MWPRAVARTLEMFTQRMRKWGEVILWSHLHMTWKRPMWASFANLLGDDQPYIYTDYRFGKTWGLAWRMENGHSGRFPDNWSVSWRSCQKKESSMRNNSLAYLFSLNDGSTWTPSKAIYQSPDHRIRIHQDDLVMFPQMGKRFLDFG